MPVLLAWILQTEVRYVAGRWVQNTSLTGSRVYLTEILGCLFFYFSAPRYKRREALLVNPGHLKEDSWKSPRWSVFIYHSRLALRTGMKSTICCYPGFILDCVCRNLVWEKGPMTGFYHKCTGVKNLWSFKKTKYHFLCSLPILLLCCCLLWKGDVNLPTFWAWK